MSDSSYYKPVKRPLPSLTLRQKAKTRRYKIHVWILFHRTDEDRGTIKMERSNTVLL